MAAESCRNAEPKGDATESNNDQNRSDHAFTEIINAYIENPRLLEEEKEMDHIKIWPIAMEFARRLHANWEKDQEPGPKDITKELEEIKKEQKEFREEMRQALQTKQAAENAPALAAKRTSWANIAATGFGVPRLGASGYIQPAIPLAPMKREREVLVKVKDDEEAKKVKAMTPSQMLETIRKAAPKEGEKIAHITRLQSGDLLVRTNTKEGKKELEGGEEWIKVLGKTAMISRKKYPVMVHGVRTSTDLKNQEQAIKKFTAENERLHPGLKAVRMAWPRSVIEAGKPFASMIVELRTAEMANALLDKGAIEGRKELDVTYFETAARITMCFNCHKYGHFAKECKNKEWCHNCGGNHSPNACGKPKGAHCPSCKSDTHKPWSKECPTWKSHKERANRALYNRPLRYAVRQEEKTTSPKVAITREEVDLTLSQETFKATTTDQGKKRKTIEPSGSLKKQGRPSAAASLAKAGTSPSQSRLEVMIIPSSQGMEVPAASDSGSTTGEESNGMEIDSETPSRTGTPNTL